jgi:hypothetical protein
MGEELDVRVAVLEEHLRGMETALQLQHEEYQRRLDELNHAHEKQVQDQATYVERRLYDAGMTEWGKWREQTNAAVATWDGRHVSRETFDSFVKETSVWRDSVRETLALLSGRSTGVSGARVLLFQILAAIMAALSLYLLFTKTV